MSDRRRWRLALPPLTAVAAAFAVMTALMLPPTAHAQAPQAPATAAPPAGADTPAPPVNSVLDTRLFYQLLVGEMALQQGDAGTAYEWLLDGARRTADEGLFRRTTDIALQARAGDQALAATRAWRQARPQSLDAVRMQLQILLLLNRAEAIAEPLGALLEQSEPSERPSVIAALPRLLQRTSEPARMAALLDRALAPYRDEADTAVAVRLALARVWRLANEPQRALALAREAQLREPAAPGPALLGLELMDGPEAAGAEALLLAYLARTDAEPPVRLAYVRRLMTQQRYADATRELEAVTRQQPGEAAPYLSLGALYLELKQPEAGEAALLRYLELAQPDKPTPAGEPGAAPGPDPASAEAEPGEDESDSARSGLVQAWLMLAQAAEQRGDFATAEARLARIDDPRRALEVQARRASILARQGRVDEARALIRQAPEREPEDARAKLMAEAGVLRDVRQWRAAYDVLASAQQRFAQDTDILYEQAMMAEKLDRLDDMERLLRRVIELKPDNAHAHNALGYSLADRKLRLPEAKALVQRALELSPGDPFITDSLGWVEFRLGNHEQAEQLLRRAWQSRPDAEIGAHLGEVLWVLGRPDDARRIWREALVRDAKNEVLIETLKRLRVEL